MGNNNSGFSIIGIIVLAVLIFLAFKLTKYLLIFLGLALLVIIIFVVLLILASKKSKPSESYQLKDQIKNILSNIKKQKFKAQNNLNRLKELANDTILTTYADLVQKYLKSELLENYETIKEKFADKIPKEQAQKCDNIVEQYKKLIFVEQQKIESLEKMQQKYEKLYQDLRKTLEYKKRSAKLDKHYQKLKTYDQDLSGEETIQKAELSLDQLRKELEYQDLYIKQLDQLSNKYLSDNQSISADEYSQNIEEILKKLQ